MTRKDSIQLVEALYELYECINTIFMQYNLVIDVDTEPNQFIKHTNLTNLLKKVQMQHISMVLECVKFRARVSFEYSCIHFNRL